MLARSAVQILSRYRYVYENEIYNLVWQHWKHILTCAHIVLLCFWRYELTKDEAEQNLSTALWLLKLAEPRWGDQARMAREKIESIAGAFGELSSTKVHIVRNAHGQASPSPRSSNKTRGRQRLSQGALLRSSTVPKSRSPGFFSPRLTLQTPTTRPTLTFSSSQTTRRDDASSFPSIDQTYKIGVSSDRP
jgi:hypothetical protein